MKNKVIFAFIFSFVTVVACFVAKPNFVCVANAETQETAEEQLSKETKSQIEKIDLTEIEEVVSTLDMEYVKEIDGQSFKSVVGQIVDGKITLSFGSLAKSTLGVVGSKFSKLLPYIGLLLVVVLLSSIFGKLRPSIAEGQIGNVIFFATFGVCVLIVSKLAFDVLISTRSSLYQVQKQMQTIFPVLLTLMTAAGGTGSVKIYQPALALLSNGVFAVFVCVLLPLFSVMFVLDVVSNMSDGVKLEKFKSLLSSVFKWVLGIVSTIFMAYLAIQGMTAATVDGVSIRTAKYAIKNYVPVIGGYISDGFEVVLASSMLIKNGVGLAAMFVLLASSLAPVIGILVLSLGLKLVAAITEPVADKKFSNFLFGVSKSLTMLLAILLGAVLMYFLSVSLVVGTANVVA